MGSSFPPADSQKDHEIAAQKRKSRKRLIYGCVFTSLLCGVIAVGTIWTFLNAMAGLAEALTGACETDVPDRIRNTANMSQFEFPPSAANIETSCFGMQGWGAYAQFEMLPSDLETFVASTRLSMAQLTTQAPQPTPGFWSARERAAGMTSYLYGRHEEYEFSQEILIDVSNSDLYVVYVYILGG